MSEAVTQADLIEVMTHVSAQIGAILEVLARKGLLTADEFEKYQAAWMSRIDQIVAQADEEGDET